METTSTRIAAASNSASDASAPASEAEGEGGESARVTQAEPRTAYAPITFFLKDGDPIGAERSLGSARFSVRLQRDPQFLLSVALALPVLAVEGASQLVLPWLAIAVPIAFVGLQAESPLRAA